MYGIVPGSEEAQVEVESEQVYVLSEAEWTKKRHRKRDF